MYPAHNSLVGATMGRARCGSACPGPRLNAASPVRVYRRRRETKTRLNRIRESVEGQAIGPASFNEFRRLGATAGLHEVQFRDSRGLPA